MDSISKSFVSALARDYRIEREIGRGAMAVVCLAEDLRHHRQVAIKVLGLGTATEHARFAREIEIVARLSHPHILPLFDSGSLEGHAYFVMPYVRGLSLQARLESTPQLPVEEALALARQVASALGHAHQQGLVHRDIKPSNILLSDGIALVADFGLARAMHPTGSLNQTTTGSILGTPLYIAPEQVQRGDEVDGRADLYSLGCVLFEMLAGRPPFTGIGAENVIFQHLSVAPPPVSDFRADVPENITRAITKALCKSPADRFATAAEFAEALLPKPITTSVNARPDQARRSGDPAVSAESPQTHSPLSRPNNLPQQLTSFVGRERETEELQELLGECRLLTLTGSGGTGKSRLSLRVAENNLERYPDGAWFVELAPLADPGLVASNVAHLLGVKESAGTPILAALTESLKHKKLLIVLDNCEHLLDAAAQLAHSLLRGCPNVQILASSRQALGVPGEQTYRVPSLSLPDPREQQTAASLSRCEAVRLFAERAALVKPDFEVTNQNAHALAQLCFHLDGIPLAIELAAARVRSLSVDEIDKRLDQRFRLLTGGSRTALPRQQTLRALVDWSYDLLSAAEKALLQRLSVFAGGATLGAAEQVCVGDPIEDWEVLDLLTSLCDKSLAVADQADSGTRYRLLNTVRQYAQDRMLEVGQAEKWTGRHLAFFVALAEEAGSAKKGIEQQRWQERFDAEHDNLRAALESCMGNPDRAEAGMRLGASLNRFWGGRGHLSEGRGYLTRILAEDPGNDHALRARVLSGLRLLAFYQGDYAAVRAYGEESLSLYRELHDGRGLAGVLNDLGIAAREQGDYPAARTLLQQSLEAASEAGFVAQIATALHNLGAVHWDLGDASTARRLYQEAQAMFRDLDDRQSVALSLVGLGELAQEEGNYAEARTFADESLRIYQAHGQQRGICLCLVVLGASALGLGDHTAARGYLKEGLKVSVRIGAMKELALSLEGLAALCATTGSPNVAFSLWGAAEALREKIGAPLRMAELATREHQIAAARATLGDDAAFDAAWAEGRAMALEQATELALSAVAG